MIPEERKRKQNSIARDLVLVALKQVPLEDVYEENLDDFLSEGLTAEEDGLAIRTMAFNLLDATMGFVEGNEIVDGLGEDVR